MRRPVRTLAILLLAAALGGSAAFLVACGDRSKLIPQGDADSIAAQLNSVGDAVDAGDCSAALSAAQRAERQINALPSDVDPALRQNLVEGLQVAGAKAQRECSEQTDTTDTTESTETETTPTETTPTQTETTQTETTPTTPTNTTPSQPTTPPGPSGGTQAPGQGGANKGGGQGQGTP